MRLTVNHISINQQQYIIQIISSAIALESKKQTDDNYKVGNMAAMLLIILHH